MKESNQQSSAKTKIRLAAPLIFNPFAALMFYALGGGSATKAEGKAAGPKGLNTFLPSPQIKDKPQDKMSLYQLDDKDSAHRKNEDKATMNLFDRAGNLVAETQGLDREEQDPIDDQGRVERPFSGSRERLGRRLSGGRRERSKDPGDELERKLAALQQTLAEQEELPTTKEPSTSSPGPDEAVIKQLEAAMAAIQQNTAPPGADPELNMMNGMLDKVLDIQHPDRVRDRVEKTKGPVEKGMRVAPVTDRSVIDQFMDPVSGTPQAALAVSSHYMQTDGFFELNNSATTGADQIQPSIAAVVHESQTLVSGSTLKIRLEQDVYIQNQRIPKGTFIYGKCSLNGERMQITFGAIRHGQLLFPVNLVAYGLDGIPGVRIPGSITRDAAKQSTNEAIQAISMGSLDPSLGAQATAAGIDAAQTLLTRKVKLVKVTIKSDYPLLLRDDSTSK